MAKGDKPAISIAVKPVGGDKGSRIYALAGWPNESQGGKVTSLQLDRRIKAVKLLLDDDSVVLITREEGGRMSHFFDLFDNREPQQQTGAQASRARSSAGGYGGGGYASGGYGATGPSGGDVPPDDFGGDDIPFDRKRGEVL